MELAESGSGVFRTTEKVRGGREVGVSGHSGLGSPALPGWWTPGFKPWRNVAHTLTRWLCSRPSRHLSPIFAKYKTNLPPETVDRGPRSSQKSPDVASMLAPASCAFWLIPDAWLGGCPSPIQLLRMPSYCTILRVSWLFCEDSLTFGFSPNSHRVATE